MNFNSLPGATQNPNTSDQNPPSGVRPVRGQQSAWGPSAPGAPSRRGLTPLSTTLTSAFADSGRTNNASSPSPFTPSFSSILNSSTQNEPSTRSSHSSSFSSSPFPSLQPGSQQVQAGQSLLSPRSRAITPSSNSQSASSAAASTTTSQTGGLRGGGSAGGGSFARSQTFSPPLSHHGLTSPTSNYFERSGYVGSTASSTVSGQSSVSKISATQILLLLGSITEKEGRAKWEAQAETIRKLVEQNGMENFPRYFRRLLSGNLPQIFPGSSRNVENPANYQILVREMEKITQDPEQAARIADAIDTADGDVYRDFDLGTFVEHFKLNALSKTLMASAFARVSRQDIRSKALALMKTNAKDLGEILTNSEDDNSNIPPTLLATCTLKYLHDSSSDTIMPQDYQHLKDCLNMRYQKLGVDPPPEIQSLYSVMGLDFTEHGLYIEVRTAGPPITATVEAARSFLLKQSDEMLDEKNIGGVILFMSICPNWQPYDVANFISALHEHPARSFDWQQIIRDFGKHEYVLSKPQLLSLYKALLPITKSNPHIDVQALWIGPHDSTFTHLSILSSFFECSPAELDVSSIPGFQPAYDPALILDEHPGLAPFAERAKQDTTISLDAITALLDACLSADVDGSEQQVYEIRQVIGDKVGFFLCSASSIGQQSPATPSRQHLLRKLVGTYYLTKGRPEFEYVLHTIWAHDKHPVAGALMDAHVTNPLALTSILELAREFGWLDGLLTMTTAFAFDLAALAHRNKVVDFTQWAEEKLAVDKAAFVNGLMRFGQIKAKDELDILRDDGQPRTVTLSMQTAYDMLTILDKHSDNRSELKVLQRTFLQAYPRLILYCEGITENVDVDCRQSNAIPQTADTDMQDLYKSMYNKHLEVTKVIEYLQECKDSKESTKTDLFACMIHGLFDEYSCFNEYPFEPLSMTAVLFGGIIKYGLISDLTLRVAREMVFDALSDYSSDASMFKFGLQALSVFTDRLQEPEWSEFCQSLAQVPGLRHTPPYTKVLEALAQHGIQPDAGDLSATDEPINGTALGGDLIAFEMGNIPHRFKHMNAGPTPTFEEPDEETKDKVVFFFNNVSQQNLGSKFGQLRKALSEEHHAWFADFLVNGRAKVEPNYQPLYLEILNQLGSKGLWEEVLRSTYSVIQKLLNSESTMQSVNERKNLKSLAVWLGSLTLARDKPIKHRYISFVDLLCEAFQFEKLLLVLPFTCYVLGQGRHSTVFKPPNPWVIEILEALVEFYKQVNITTNQKFDIEVLCDELGVDINSIMPSNVLSERPLDMDEPTNLMLSSGMQHYDSLSLGGINGNVQNPKYEVDAMHFDLPNLEQILKFPPPIGSAASQARLRHMVVEAVTHAIHEIIGSVVERSVTIATIATSNLINKDFSCEGDDERLRQAAHRMARELASSLALVTSKDPLKTSMNSFIRRTQAESSEQPFPEGTILMCINDNLDLACEIVENQAADQAMPEIESHVEREIAVRVQWKLDHSDEPYVGSAHNRWSSAIPEPYKQSPNGLKNEQIAIYAEFGRQPRGPPSHGQTPSVDGSRQVPDVLQDAFASLPQNPVTADNMALSHHVIQPQQYQQQRGRMLPPPLLSSTTQTHTNGYADPALIEERVRELLNEIFRTTELNNGQPLEDASHEASLFDMVEQVKDLSSSFDTVALDCAGTICSLLYGDRMVNRLLAKVFVHILADLCHTYQTINREVAKWADQQTDTLVMITDVTIELVKGNILNLKKVDESLANLINQRDEAAVEALSTIVNEVFLSAHPDAYRADFARSLGALAQWYSEDQDMPIATEMWHKLSQAGDEEDREHVSDQRGLVRKHQVDYVFAEWTRLCEQNTRKPNDKMFAAFMMQVQVKRLVQSQEDVAVFIRLCIDAATATCDSRQQEDRQTRQSQKEHSNESFIAVDWLARFVVCLVKSQDEAKHVAKRTRAAHMESILSLITLTMNHHQVTRGEHLNQRVFYRLLSGIYYDWHDFAQEATPQNEEMLLVFAQGLLLVGPRYFPSFIYSWMGLISHRVFMPRILRVVRDDAYLSFTGILEAALAYISGLLKSKNVSPTALELYKGLLRIILVLHHDFPEFLAETHFRLCNAIPPCEPQLLNLILSAHPSSLAELPSPFMNGLKIDRLEEIRRAPRSHGDYGSSLDSANIKTSLEAAFRNNGQEFVSYIAEAVYVRKGLGNKIDSQLLQSVVLYLGQSAVSASNQRGSSAFVSDSPQAILLRNLFKTLRADGRYHLICSMVNQLRWPNAHTQYFAYALLHLFGTDMASQEDLETRQQVVRVLLERMYVIPPHPWGLIVVMLELLKNPTYNLWSLPFMKDSPQVHALCEDLLKLGEDREQRWPPGQYAQQI